MRRHSCHVTQLSYICICSRGPCHTVFLFLSFAFFLQKPTFNMNMNVDAKQGQSDVNQGHDPSGQNANANTAATSRSTTGKRKRQRRSTDDSIKGTRGGKAPNLSIDTTLTQEPDDMIMPDAEDTLSCTKCCTRAPSGTLWINGQCGCASERSGTEYIEIIE